MKGNYMKLNNKVTSVYSTMDYDVFTFIEGNRELDHVKAVKESIEKVGFLWVPILVNEKFEIIEGQHRFTACKELGLPVIYIIQPNIGMKEVQALNTCAKRWTIKNHIHAYASGEMKTTDGLYLDILVKKYPWASVDTILAATSKYGFSNSKANIIEGKINCSSDEYEMADRVLSYIEKTLPYIREKKVSVTRALCYLYSLGVRKPEVIDVNHLQKRFVINNSRFEPDTKIQTNIDRIQDQVYNFGTRSDRRAQFSHIYGEEQRAFKRASAEAMNSKKKGNK